jgi:serine/threonine-protein kinase
VPDLIGKDKDTAIGMLQEAGLDPIFGEQQFSETVPDGSVISADPASGSLIRGSDVKLVISKGQERFVVDAGLGNQPAAAVLAKLQAQFPSLVFQQTKQTSETIAAGNVISFDPPAGSQLKAGDTVTLVVSAGRAPVKVPDVVGLSPDSAAQNLSDRGFKVVTAQGRSAAVDTGKVMAVSPGPGDGAQPYGSTVTVTVSVGLPQVAVPDVTGKKKDDAVAILQQAGLKAQVQQFFGSNVLRQTPSAGATVDMGTTVTILVTFG